MSSPRNYELVLPFHLDSEAIGQFWQTMSSVASQRNRGNDIVESNFSAFVKENVAAVPRATKDHELAMLDAHRSGLLGYLDLVLVDAKEGDRSPRFEILYQSNLILMEVNDELAKLMASDIAEVVALNAIPWSNQVAFDKAVAMHSDSFSIHVAQALRNPEYANWLHMQIAGEMALKLDCKGSFVCEKAYDEHRTIAIIDGGINAASAALTSTIERLWSHIKAGNASRVKFNYVSDVQDFPYDCPNGHGTLLALLIGGEIDYLKSDFFGIASGCLMIPVKVCQNRLTNSSIVASAMSQFLDRALGCDMIVMTFTTTECCPGLQAVVEAFHRKGILVVAASGNESDLPSYPGMWADMYNNLVCVGASSKDRPDVPTSYTNPFNPTSLLLPGSGLPESPEWKALGYGSQIGLCIEGTSYAAAVAAGAIRLMSFKKSKEASAAWDCIRDKTKLVSKPGGVGLKCLRLPAEC